MNLTIEQMREIVAGAPKLAVSVNLHNGMYYDLREVGRGDLWLMDLRTALADHERMTIVVISKTTLAQIQR